MEVREGVAVFPPPPPPPRGGEGVEEEEVEGHPLPVEVGQRDTVRELPCVEEMVYVAVGEGD